VSVDPPGFRPDRNYPIDVGHAYPDSSRPFGALGVIRSLRTEGQQMWDEDQNNAHVWLSYYVSLYAHYWRVPNAPYYTPLISNFILDPNQSGAYAGPFEDAVYLQRPSESIPLQAWAGLKVPAMADRILVAYNGAVWRGVASWHWYNDVIEIAFFVSQVFRDKIMASYVVEEEFTITVSGEGCRVRGWPDDAPQIKILRNGVQVGNCDHSSTSSGATMFFDATFSVGDVLSLKAPDDIMINGLLGPSITLIGGLS